MGEEKEKPIGTIFNFFDKVSVAAVELHEDLNVGDSIRVIGGDKDFTQSVDSIQIEGQNMDSAKSGDKVGIKLVDKVRKGYKVYKA